MITLLITEQAKQQELNTIRTIAENNGFPLNIIHNIKNKVIIKTQKNPHKHIKRKKWITFIYHSPLIHKVTNLFRYTNFNIAFRDTNTICKLLSDNITQNKINSTGIYKLTCNTCNNSYVGQTGSSFGV
jgi:hypothetical protein